MKKDRSSWKNPQISSREKSSICNTYDWIHIKIYNKRRNSSASNKTNLKVDKKLTTKNRKVLRQTQGKFSKLTTLKTHKCRKKIERLTGREILKKPEGVHSRTLSWFLWSLSFGFWQVQLKIGHIWFGSKWTPFKTKKSKCKRYSNSKTVLHQGAGITKRTAWRAYNENDWLKKGQAPLWSIWYLMDCLPLNYNCIVNDIDEI